MKKKPDLLVNGTVVRVLNVDGADFLCISDIAMIKNLVEPKDVVKNWMRMRATISFLGLWEKLPNATITSTRILQYVRRDATSLFARKYCNICAGRG